jgi:hypothetical protein
LQQNRDDVLRCGESVGCDLLKAAVRQQEAQSQSQSRVGETSMVIAKAQRGLQRTASTGTIPNGTLGYRRSGCVCCLSR